MSIDLQRIRDYVARPPLLVAPSVEELAARYAGKHVVIVGSGPTGLRDLSALGVPVWAVGTAWIQHRYADLTVMMDDLKGPAWDEIRGIGPDGQRADEPRAEWEAVWHECPVPILTSRAYAEFPQTVEYPLEAILQTCKRRYFAESITYAIAWAIQIGVKKLTFVGCDYAGVRPAERAGCEYWIGRAEASGIEIAVVPGSSLLQTGPLDGKNRHVPGLYGYTDYSPAPFAGHELANLPLCAGLEGANLGDLAMEKLLSLPGIKTVLDVGCGSGKHARHMADAGRKVIGVDLVAKDDYWEPLNGGSALILPFDFLSPDTSFSEQFDAIWTCHVLEHVDNPHVFLSKCFENLRVGGTLAVTVPPAQHAVVGGHFTLWNAGLLVYHLIRAGFDCKQASIKQYGYNLSILVQKPNHAMSVPTAANFPIEKLKFYLPEGLRFDAGAFNGDIRELNWHDQEAKCAAAPLAMKEAAQAI